MICSRAIAQDNAATSGSPAKKSIALGAGSALMAPRMVLPAAARIKLKRGAKKKAHAAYPSSHYQKGMYFKQKGDKSRALVEFLKTTQENPRLIKAYYEQALIFRERGYLKLAQSSLEQALAIKPDYQEGRMLMATVQIQQGNVGGAMQQLGQSLGINLATADGDKRDDDGELPVPTVLQSLHSLLPEGLARQVAKMTASKGGSPSKQSSKPANKPEQKLALAKHKNKAETNAADQNAGGDTLKITEPQPNNDGDAAFALHIPNPLHLQWPGSKPNEEQAKQTASLDANNLPTLPPEEAKAEASAEQKPAKAKRTKRAKKSWFGKLLVADDQHENSSPIPAMASAEPPSSSALPPTSLAPPLSSSAAELAAVQSATQASPVTAGGAAALKSDQLTEMPSTVETFQKPDEPKQIIERVATMASAALSNLGKIPFQLPTLPSSNLSLFNTMSGANAAVHPDPRIVLPSEEPKNNKPQIAPNSDDPWSVRLRYLADHGTGTLKEGEAFMFSEETGEATLFLSDGQTVRRTIYLPRDAQEVVKQRRPDILTPDDLLYNLSLLAKLMPKPNEQEQPAAAAKTEHQAAPTPNFEVNDLMGKSQNFWGWIKSTLKI
jgi:tetratricopeptide (TPR) repeat protein